MEDPKWLKFMTIGLVLAALAVGYFLFTSRFSSNTTTKTGSQVSQATSSASPASVATATAFPKASTTPTPAPTAISAYNRIVSRNQNVQTLPNTGFPAGLVATLTASIMISGWGLRRFPH